MGLDDFRNWDSHPSGWIKEGTIICYIREGVVYYELALQRDMAHWVYDWPETISVGVESGPYVPELLEITKGYDTATNTNQIWQVIFGIRSQAYVYVELPTDLHRHGIPKRPKPGTAQWTVSHFTETMSPYIDPTFITEHFMMRPITLQICLSAYNPEVTDLTALKINFFINKLVTQRLGTVVNGVRIPTKPRFAEILEGLYKRMVPFRPITLMPVRAPAEAPGGE